MFFYTIILYNVPEEGDLFHINIYLSVKAFYKSDEINLLLVLKI